MCDKVAVTNIVAHLSCKSMSCSYKRDRKEETELNSFLLLYVVIWLREINQNSGPFCQVSYLQCTCPQNDSTQVCDFKATILQPVLKLVTCGVPHGSVLGPRIFLRHVNDRMAAAVALNIVLYEFLSFCLNFFCFFTLLLSSYGKLDIHINCQVLKLYEKER